MTLIAQEPWPSLFALLPKTSNWCMDSQKLELIQSQAGEVGIYVSSYQTVSGGGVFGPNEWDLTCYKVFISYLTPS